MNLNTMSGPLPVCLVVKADRAVFRSVYLRSSLVVKETLIWVWGQLKNIFSWPIFASVPIFCCCNHHHTIPVGVFFLCDFSGSIATDLIEPQRRRDKEEREGQTCFLYEGIYKKKRRSLQWNQMRWLMPGGQQPVQRVWEEPYMGVKPLNRLNLSTKKN